MQRRQFALRIATGGLTFALARSLEAGLIKNGIGLQLWTVRNQLQADQRATLTAIAEAGYQQIELMNVLESASIVQEAQDLGLRIRSAFINWETVGNPQNADAPAIESIIERAQEYGLEYLVFGYIGKAQRDTADKLRRIAARANLAAEKVRSAGMKLSYHNHAFEFERIAGDKTGYELLVEGFDPELVNFELDVFWAAIGGFDPLALLKQLGPRVGQVHLKDLKAGVGTIYDEGKVPADAFQEVGDGVLDFSAIMELAIANGVQQFHVEQDESPDPIASIGQSIKYVRGIW